MRNLRREKSRWVTKKKVKILLFVYFQFYFCNINPGHGNVVGYLPQFVIKGANIALN